MRSTTDGATFNATASQNYMSDHEPHDNIYIISLLFHNIVWQSEICRQFADLRRVRSLHCLVEYPPEAM